MENMLEWSKGPQDCNKKEFVLPFQTWVTQPILYILWADITYPGRLIVIICNDKIHKPPISRIPGGRYRSGSTYTGHFWGEPTANVSFLQPWPPGDG